MDNHLKPYMVTNAYCEVKFLNQLELFSCSSICSLYQSVRANISSHRLHL